MDARSTCDGNTVHLARSEGDDIMRLNRRAGWSIAAACQATPANEPADDRQRPTRSDDKTFRLTRMLVEACR